jgi:hypothetical protein
LLFGEDHWEGEGVRQSNGVNAIEVYCIHVQKCYDEASLFLEIKRSKYSKW